MGMVYGTWNNCGLLAQRVLFLSGVLCCEKFGSYAITQTSWEARNKKKEIVNI